MPAGTLTVAQKQPKARHTQRSVAEQAPPQFQLTNPTSSTIEGAGCSGRSRNTQGSIEEPSHLLQTTLSINHVAIATLVRQGQGL